MIKEFKPTILFLAKFLGIYLAGNFIYGLWITSCYPQPDPVTNWVTWHSAEVLTWLGWEVEVVDHASKATTRILFEGRPILAVYEGCNGLNVVIVFIAFLFAFGPVNKSLLWFLPMGLLIIHLSNILRIVLLFWVSIKMPDYLYFTHKYLFTAFIYFFVFILWIVWVMRYGKATRVTHA
jgi:exosortase family protein XrtF